MEQLDASLTALDALVSELGGSVPSLNDLGLAYLPARARALVLSHGARVQRGDLFALRRDLVPALDRTDTVLNGLVAQGRAIVQGASRSGGGAAGGGGAAR